MTPDDRPAADGAPDRPHPSASAPGGGVPGDPAADLHRRLVERLPDLLASPADPPAGGSEVLGTSREDRPIRAWRMGAGPRRVSLLAGCHADEPVGPHLLRKLVTLLADLPPRDPLLSGFEWWILPHLNPDGEARNRAWYDETRDGLDYGLVDFVRGVEREPPGPDVEFGFPRGEDDEGARPENRAARRWWARAEGSFDLHASLHGMAVGAGPWYLVEPAWADRCGRLMERCRRATERLGYRLHDDPRRGEKGFRRLARGFSTRPDSRAMREHFRARGEDATARLFRPSSMETIRSLGGDPLTLVSEMPLFLAPVDGGADAEDGGDADRDREGGRRAAYAGWKERLGRWRRALASGEADPSELAATARAAGVRAMPVEDQMRLQWAFVAAGLGQVEAAPDPRSSSGS